MDISVTIGFHSIVGVRSVVTKDVPEDVMIAGKPSVIKNIDKEFYKD